LEAGLGPSTTCPSLCFAAGATWKMLPCSEQPLEMDRSVCLLDCQWAIGLPLECHPTHLMKLEGIRFIGFPAAY
jgi:hypothetical protein